METLGRQSDFDTPPVAGIQEALGTPITDKPVDNPCHGGHGDIHESRQIFHAGFPVMDKMLHDQELGDGQHPFGYFLDLVPQEFPRNVRNDF